MILRKGLALKEEEIYLYKRMNVMHEVINMKLSVKMVAAAAVVAVMLSSTGCASLSQALAEYQPVVQGEVPPKDLIECGKLAKKGYMVPMAGGMMMGGMMGAAGGAAVGAVIAGASIATASGIGAVAGIPMAVWAFYTEKEKFEIGFRTCLRDRGHLVVR